MNDFVRLIICALFFFSSADAAEHKPLVIVTEAYPPFVFQKGDATIGSDWDVVKAILRDMDIPFEIRFCPWKRCLLAMRSGNADAILDVSQTAARQQWMTFPEEHLSDAPTVFFKRAEDTVPFATLADLSALTVGTQLGYRYCDALDDPPFHVEKAKSLAINFNKLIYKRVDLVASSWPVGKFTAARMRISSRIDTVPGAIFCDDEQNYLAFSRRGASRIDVKAFSNNLHHFKRTQAYRRIMARYGLNGGTFAANPDKALQTAPPEGL